jgi:Na+/H+ antiporter
MVLLSGGVPAVETVVLLLLAFVGGFALLARRLDTPYPIVLVVAGLVLGFLPDMPAVELDPDLIFLALLPPLLYAAAWQTSWREFRYNFATIFLLAFGLVAFVVLVVAVAAPLFFEGFTWETGLVLGAVVSTTDAIAATSIARRLGLPSTIVDILEGESLINDATGLLALQAATTLVVLGQKPSLVAEVGHLAWLVAAGVGVGVAVATVVAWLERRVDDGPIEITLGLLVPYATYLAAESVHASGVLAVVACGLLLSRQSASFFTPRVRLQAWAVWEALTFVLNGFVFVLIGLQLPSILSRLTGHSRLQLLGAAAAFSVLLIAIRFVWTYPSVHLASFLRRRVGRQNEACPSGREIFVVGWVGMRGVVALAAALSLPVRLADGSPFPHRDMILFLTFCVILVTLVGQGLLLSPIIRVLGLANVAGPDCEERDARRIMIDAALAHLERARAVDGPEFARVYDDLYGHYRHQQAALADGDDGDDARHATHHDRFESLSLDLLQVQRRAAIALRDEGRIGDEVLRRLERELDLGEARLDSSDE